MWTIAVISAFWGKFHPIWFQDINTSQGTDITGTAFAEVRYDNSEECIFIKQYTIIARV